MTSADLQSNKIYYVGILLFKSIFYKKNFGNTIYLYEILHLYAIYCNYYLRPYNNIISLK